MADKHSVQARLKNMRAVKKENTDIENVVSLLLNKLGISFHKNEKTLPGSPDFVIKNYNAVIFTHGCFWHHHTCRKAKLPDTNRKFWMEKIEKNVLRDHRNITSLLAKNWRVLIIWECAIKGKNKLTEQQLADRIEEWLCAGSCYVSIDSQGIKKMHS